MVALNIANSFDRVKEKLPYYGFLTKIYRVISDLLTEQSLHLKIDGHQACFSTHSDS